MTATGPSGKLRWLHCLHTGDPKIDGDAKRAAEEPGSQKGLDTLWFPGIKHPNKADVSEYALIGMPSLYERSSRGGVRRDRKSGFNVNKWMLEAGNLNTLREDGRFETSVEDYATRVRRWWHLGHLLAVIPQDAPCKQTPRKVTGLSVEDHQRITLDSYMRLKALLEQPPFPEHLGRSPYVMPVLQGSTGREYANHLEQYLEECPEGLPGGAWVAVGRSDARDYTPRAAGNLMHTLLDVRGDLLFHVPSGLKKFTRDAPFHRLTYSQGHYRWGFPEDSGEDGNDHDNIEKFARREREALESGSLVYQPDLGEALDDF